MKTQDKTILMKKYALLLSLLMAMSFNSVGSIIPAVGDEEAAPFAPRAGLSIEQK